MITSTSKNNSFICVEDICDHRMIDALECSEQVEPRVHLLKKYLRDLWINIRLFLETDKWEHIVTLKMGDSHYTMKMDDIEARWRNR
jgi:hypothetical protein